MSEQDSGMRINRFLAQAGQGSRRACDDLVRLQRVHCNGRLVTDLGLRVLPGDRVEVDGKEVRISDVSRVWMLHKPAGYLCTKEDTHGRTTVYELLPESLQHLHYVGRLDYDTRGLLLMTADGELSQALTRPETGVPRCYRVWSDRKLFDKDAVRLESGLVLADGTVCRPAEVYGRGFEFEIVLREGKKREIREMMRTLGHRVRDLLRLEYGGIELDVPEGRWRELDHDEVEHLRSWMGAARGASPSSGISRP